MMANRFNNIIDGERLIIQLHGTLDDALGKTDINAAVINNAVSQKTIDGSLQIAHTSVTGLGNERDNIYRNLQTVTTNLIAQDIHTQLDIRLLQLADQAARETGEQTVWHILQLYRRAVARQDNTLSVAEKVVEDMEEGIQRLRLTSPLLDIIHNQHIDRLIEVDEIIARIMEHGIGILGLEKTGTHIEYTLLRIHLLRFQADGIHQMRLTATRRSVNEHWVKLGGVGMLGNRQSYGTRQLIAVTLHIIVESKLRV